MANRAAAFLLLLCLPALSGCLWLNRKLLYVPSTDKAGDPFTKLGLYFEDAVLRNTDGPHGSGPRLQAWWVPHGSPDAPVVLFFHGNGGNITHRLERLRRLRLAGASVMFFDYRGYGMSEGVPSEDGTYLDAEAALRWLKLHKELDPSKLVYYGESLGCGVAVELARRHPPRGLVLDSGFTSVKDMARALFPRLPVRWLVRYKYDNVSKLPSISAPLLVLHSPQDDIIPFEQGRRNFDAAKGPKTFFELTGNHNVGFILTGRPYVDAVKAFLESLPR